MCGIVACIGSLNSPKIVLKGLKMLEYRGYDSWGIASLRDGVISIEKRAGRISEANAALPCCGAAIGHTRWATHGKVSALNAHPHTDCSGKIAVVHNGVIENFSGLKQMLSEKGHVFRSETDTEVIPHLIEEEMKSCPDFRRAFGNAMVKLLGSFAVAAMESGSPGIAAARKNSPLALGISDKALFLASDPVAFAGRAKKAVFLDDDEMVFLGGGSAVFSDFALKERQKQPVTLDFADACAEKSGFRHFMLKEIMEQPEKISAAMEGRIFGEKIALKEIDPVLGRAHEFERVVFRGCGTAFYAGLFAKYVFEELCRLPAEAEYASEFRYKNPVVDAKTLVIAVSQSGETADTLAAVMEARAKHATVLSIVNVPGSAIARESDFVLCINAGPEIGVASTKAFTCMMAALSMVAIAFAQQLKSASDETLRGLVLGMKELPEQIACALRESPKIEAIAAGYFGKPNALFLGRGANFPIALEGALKLKEISYIHAEAMPAAEMKHGPIALIDRDMPVVFIAVNGKSYEKILGNIEEVKARGGRIIAVANSGNSALAGIVDEAVFVPKAPELLQPIIDVVPLQLFAYYVAEKRGCDIDKPRNLAKSVTVE